MESLWLDIRYGTRALCKTPAFTLAVLLTLTLGIGANTAIFSAIDAVLLQPLPFPKSGQLVNLTQSDPTTPGLTSIEVSFTKFTAIKAQNHSLEDLAAYYPLTVSLFGQREPEMVSAAHASLDLFRTLGVEPALGRNFLADEDQPGGRDVAVISDGIWHSHFGADPGLVGKSMIVDGKDVVVVGILPPKFRFPLQFPEPQIWMPRVFETSFVNLQQIQSGSGYLNVVGRLRPNVVLSRLTAELGSINANYRQQFSGNSDTRFNVVPTPLGDSLVGDVRPTLLVLMATVVFVLLTACANVASLLLVRAAGRQKELAIRKALGASRWQLVRQLISESLLLSLSGGMLGIGVAAALLSLARLISPGTVPRLEQTSIDGSVLLFTAGISLLAGLAAGIAPAIEIAQRRLNDELKEGGRGFSDIRSRKHFRSVLVVAEVAVAVVLVTGAVLLIQSFARLLLTNPGFESRGLMAFHVALPKLRYPMPERQVQFYSRLLEHVRSLPGVQTAGLTSNLPLAGATPHIFFCPEGTVCRGIGKDPVIARVLVSPDYFQTMRTPLLSGRFFSEQDVATGNNVVMVNHALAVSYWPNQNPVGKFLMNSRDRIQRQVVGVVADVKFSALSAPDFPQVFLPILQVAWPEATLVVRSPSDPAALVGVVRQEIAKLDSTLPLSSVLTVDDVVSKSVAHPRLIAQFVGVFAGLALLLAALGIYAVVACWASQHRREMGIRMALGARRTDLVMLVVGQGMRLVLGGVVIGSLSSFALTRLLVTLLFGTRATDPLAFSVAPVLLSAAAFLACNIPAQRAARLDPMLALRRD